MICYYIIISGLTIEIANAKIKFIKSINNQGVIYAISLYCYPIHHNHPQ